MKRTILNQVFLMTLLMLVGYISLQAQTSSYSSYKSNATGELKKQSEGTYSPFIFVRQVANTRQDKGVSRYNELRIDKTSLGKIQKDKPGMMTMDFPVSNGEVLKLQLKKNFILSDDFTIGVNDHGNYTEDLDLGIHYSGTGILNGKKVVCAFSFFKDNIEGMISGHELINITSIKTPENTEAISYYQRDMIGEQPLGCGNVHDGIDYRPEQLQAPIESREAKCVRIWWECNYNVYQNLGSDMTNTVIFNLTLFNAYHTIYQNESIKVLLHHLEIWTSPSPYTDPSDPMVDDRDEFLNKFKSNRSGSFTGDLAGLITQNNIGGVAAGFSGLCNATRSESMCISGLYSNTVGSYPGYAFNVYITSHEFGHLFGSRHTHACVWNGDNTAIDGCSGDVEGSCPLPGNPTGGGTIMSYCWNLTGIDFTLGFGPQPGNVIRNSVNAAACLVSCCNPAFNPTVTTNSPVCQGGTLTLSVSGGDLFAWTGPGGFKSTASSASVNNISLAQAGTYNLITTNAQGCIAAISTNVVVNPKPNAQASATPNPICSGGTLQLSASGGATYAWSGPSGYSSGQQNPSISNISTSMSGSFVVNVTSAQGCSSLANVNVTVNPTPTATASANPSSVCEGQNINLSATGGVSYIWSGPGGWTSNQQNPTRNNATLAMMGTYSVTVTSGAGCNSVATVSVVVNPLPNAQIKVDPNPVCSGRLVRFHAAGGVSYAWSGPGGWTSNLPNPVIGNIQTNQAGTYSVTVTNEAGCNASRSATLVVNQTPNGAASVSPQSVCVGAQAFFTATGGTNYSWRGPGGWTSTQQNPVLNITSHVQKGTYWVDISNNNGCYMQLSLDLDVNYPPVVTATHDKSTACTGSLLSFSGSGTGNYQWTGPGGFNSSLPNPVIPNVSPANNGVYTLKVTNASGCSATASTTVNVVAPPVVTATVDDNSVCEGSSVYLHSSGAAGYIWLGPWGWVSNLKDPVVFTIPSYMSGIYTVTGTGVTGCKSSASVNVDVFPYINGTIGATPNPVGYGGALYLNATGGSSYLWTGPNGFYATSPDPVIYNFNKNKAGTYAVIITNGGGCEMTLFVDVVMTAPIGGDTDNFKVSTTKIMGGKIYPNPASNMISLEKHAESKIVYSIIDMQGRIVVKNAVSDSGLIDVDHLMPGAYKLLWSQPEVVGNAFKGEFIKIR